MGTGSWCKEIHSCGEYSQGHTGFRKTIWKRLKNIHTDICKGISYIRTHSGRDWKDRPDLGGAERAGC